MIIMNRDAWNELSAEQQTAIEAAALDLETASIERFDALAVTELADLKELGMKETRFSDADAEKLEDLWANGVWSISEGKAGAEATALREQAKAAGLTR